MSAKKYPVKLTVVQRQKLTHLVNAGRAPARQLTHARILLKADQRDEACDDLSIVEALAVSGATVQRVRKAFAQRGLEVALQRQPQPPRPDKRVIDGASEAKLVMLACSTPPEGHGHWTLDLLADRMVQLHYLPEGKKRVSRDTVGRVLKKTKSSRG